MLAGEKSCEDGKDGLAGGLVVVAGDGGEEESDEVLYLALLEAWRGRQLGELSSTPLSVD